MEPPEPEQTPVPKEVLAKLEKLMASLMYSPDVIQSMSIDEVRKEIAELGLDPNTVKQEFEERIRIIRGRVDSMLVYDLDFVQNKGGSTFFMQNSGGSIANVDVFVTL